jgi:hypothetical protein
MNLAEQKNCVALYHMGLSGDGKIKAWFIEEYTKRFKRKPDMGTGCMGFNKDEIVPDIN